MALTKARLLKHDLPVHGSLGGINDLAKGQTSQDGRETEPEQETSEPFFKKPKDEPYQLEPFFRNRSRIQNHPFCKERIETVKSPFQKSETWNHPNFEKNALGVKRPFSEQVSEFRGILGAILGMALTT